MRRRAIALSILSSTAVLGIGWQLGAQAQAQPQPQAPAAEAAPGSTTDSGASTPGAAAGSTPSDSPATTAPAAPAAPAPAAQPPSASTDTSAGASGTFTGTSTRTRFGDVQVQITVENGSITDVTALQLTDADSRSVSISNRAAPMLRQEVLTAQSADVKTISGATYTSDGYLTSLQSALDQAGL